MILKYKKLNHTINIFKYNYLNMLSIETTMQVLYSTLNHKKKKERFETILEPLQALLQICFLSFTPIGTKLTIQNNILHIQQPSYTQSITRWYNNDTQEDLFYLFNIFYRFKKFYAFLNEKQKNTNTINNNLYDLIIELAKSGIINLIRTYSQTDKHHILHTLQMYKNILDNPNDIANRRLESFELEGKQMPDTITGMNSHSLHIPTPPSSMNINENKKIKNKPKQSVIPDDTYGQENNTITNESGNQNYDQMNIDDVFIRITNLYSQEMYNIIYNTLIILKNTDINYQNYIDGLNKILDPTNLKIKKWIDENIVF